MNYVPQINRRAFVVSAAAFGGGLALGMDLPFGPDVVRAADGIPELTAWVVIKPIRRIEHGGVHRLHGGVGFCIAGARALQVSNATPDAADNVILEVRSRKHSLEHLGSRSDAILFVEDPVLGDDRYVIRIVAFQVDVRCAMRASPA